MRICYSTLACPEWDIETIARKGKEFGYDGVDFYNLKDELNLPSLPAFSFRVEQTRDRLASAGLEIVALSCDAAFDCKSKKDATQQMDRARRYLDAAAAVDARFVRVLATDSIEVGDEQSRLARAGERLAELGRHAVDRRVGLVVENAGSFCKCESIWWLIDRVANPRVGACWNPVAALDGVERPSKSIPTLGQKTHYFKARNVTVASDNTFTPAALGEGELDLKLAIEVLKGIGYDGYLCFEWDRLWAKRLVDAGSGLGPLAGAEEALAAAAGQLKQWLGVAETVTKE